MTSVLYDEPGPKARRLSRVISVVVAIVVVAAIGYALFALGREGLFDADRWDVFQDPLVWQSLLGALGTTLQIAGLAAVLAIALGMVLALLRMSTHRLIRIPVTIVLEFFRGMPVLLMIFFILVLFSTGQYVAVVAGLALYNGAIIGEALRSGLVALPRGQREAGLSVGMRSLQTRLLVEFPQAFRNMLPIIIAQLVVLLKDTSLGSIVGYIELVRRQRLLAEFYGANQYIFSFFVITVAMYLVINLTVSFIARYAARRLDRPVPLALPDESAFASTPAGRV